MCLNLDFFEIYYPYFVDHGQSGNISLNRLWNFLLPFKRRLSKCWIHGCKFHWKNWHCTRSSHNFYLKVQKVFILRAEKDWINRGGGLTDTVSQYPPPLDNHANIHLHNCLSYLGFRRIRHSVHVNTDYLESCEISGGFISTLRLKHIPIFYVCYLNSRKLPIFCSSVAEMSRKLWYVFNHFPVCFLTWCRTILWFISEIFHKYYTAVVVV